jgi:hypothetical protein
MVITPGCVSFVGINFASTISQCIVVLYSFKTFSSEYFLKISAMYLCSLLGVVVWTLFGVGYIKYPWFSSFIQRLQFLQFQTVLRDKANRESIVFMLD